MRIQALLLSAFAFFPLHSALSETLLERGDYLVNAVMACDGCHTTRPAPGAAPARLAGGPQTWDTPWYTVKGTNITPDKETGIGAWSDPETLPSSIHTFCPMSPDGGQARKIQTEPLPADSPFLT